MQRVLEAKCLAVLAWVLLLLPAAGQQNSRPELLLRGGTVVDGTGPKRGKLM